MCGGGSRNRLVESNELRSYFIETVDEGGEYVTEVISKRTGKSRMLKTLRAKTEAGAIRAHRRILNLLKSKTLFGKKSQKRGAK